MLFFSINRSRGYENPSLDIIVTEHCSIGGCPLEEACEHCYLIQSAISVAISYIISVYCEDYAGYFTVILSFLAFRFYSAYFIYLVSCIQPYHCSILTITTLSPPLKSMSKKKNAPPELLQYILPLSTMNNLEIQQIFNKYSPGPGKQIK
jgi:hypothetical protein